MNKEPQVFSRPDMGKCFHLFPMVDLWMTMFASPGSRAGDGKANDFLLTGPGWSGEVPKGMTHIPVATRYLVILGRTYADGTDADYAAANALSQHIGHRVTSGHSTLKRLQGCSSRSCSWPLSVGW